MCIFTYTYHLHVRIFMKYPIGDLFTPPSYCIYNLTTTAISTGTTNNNGTTAMTTMLPPNQPLQNKICDTRVGIYNFNIGIPFLDELLFLLSNNNNSTHTQIP